MQNANAQQMWSLTQTKQFFFSFFLIQMTKLDKYLEQISFFFFFIKNGVRSCL